MRKRPISIVLMSLICFSIGPTYLGYHLWFQKLDPTAQLSSFNPVHLLIGLLALPVGVGIFRVKPWGYFSFLTYAIGIVSYFLYEYFATPVLHNYVLLVAAVVLVGTISVLIQKHISAPYFNPKLRWWERDPRFRVNLQAEFQIDGGARQGALLDLSLSGCYATIDTKLEAGDAVNVGIQLLDHRIATLATVIWVNPEGGYGIMFTDLERDEKKELKNIINYLALSTGDVGAVVDSGVPAH